MEDPRLTGELRLAGELHQLVLHVDDLVEPCLEKMKMVEIEIGSPDGHLAWPTARGAATCR
jgi:hypothetical protein